MAKLVDDRVKSVAFVAGAAETHASRVKHTFEEMFGAYATREEKQRLPDMGLALVLVARAMRDKSAKAQTATDKHELELQDDDKPRVDRDSDAAKLYTELVDLRGAVAQGFGDATVHDLGYEGKTPEDPAALATLARKVVKVLRNDKYKWPKQTHKGIKVDPHQWQSDIETHLAALTKDLGDVTREEHEANATLAEKNRAIADNDGVFGPGASFVSAALAVVGEADLATKVRPSQHRPGTVESPPEPVPVPAK